MVTILHFADAHIDMVTHGRRDPATGLPVRVLDFLKALDAIVDTAIEEKVDLVLFAGDTYRDRTPVPTFQREWGKRIMRLSEAGIPTLLLVGNHDLSPAIGRAHALQEFDTLQVPHIHVIGRPTFLQSDQLEGLPLQVLALPWVSRSSLMASLELSGAKPEEIYDAVEERLEELIHKWLEQIDPGLPVILTAHASVQGAKYGGERSIMLGGDVVLSGGLVRDPRINYVALGHIHKAQNLNEGQQPPVIYPGSIERVDFGEAADDKYFVLAHIERSGTQVEWRKLEGRKFIDRFVRVQSPDSFQSEVMSHLPPQHELENAIVRLIVEYPRQWEEMLDEAAVRRYAEPAFEFHLVRRPQLESRLRIPEDHTISSLSALELLDMYWKAIKVPENEIATLQKIASEVVSSGGVDVEVEEQG
jgi:DNA repair protein SbcD/Mre11